MKKKIISLIAATTLAASVSASALAAQGVVDRGVNFRTAPSTNSSIIRTLGTGTTFDVLEEVNSYWVRASVNGQTGYVSRNYITITASASTTATVSRGVNFRSQPSTSSTIYRLLPTGTSLQVLSQVNAYWLHVSVNGQQGYVSSSYVSTASTSQPVSTPSLSKADRIINRALNLRGITQYRYGVNNAPNFLDCSSFTKYVFELEGVSMRWGTRYQKDMGTAVSKANLRKGDLVFFWTSTRGTIGHVGIYMGDGQFVHNSSSNNGVTISSLNSGYWSDRYMSARRVL